MGFQPGSPNFDPFVKPEPYTPYSTPGIGDWNKPLSVGQLRLALSAAELVEESKVLTDQLKNQLLNGGITPELVETLAEFTKKLGQFATATGDTALQQSVDWLRENKVSVGDTVADRTAVKLFGRLASVYTEIQHAERNSVEGMLATGSEPMHLFTKRGG